MKKIILISFVLHFLASYSQDDLSKNSTHFELGKGLTFDLNEGKYKFFISGFIQPTVSVETIKGEESDYFFNSKRSFFMLGGKAVQEKISFLLQTDFSSRNPLLDAWIAYHPYEWLTISAGQKQNFANNREMLYREDRLQFTDRSLGSRTFSKTGREFGLFVESTFGEKFILSPKFSLTSGDGQNSFGTDSRDTDLGGLKVGGRLDIYPFGAFKTGNDLFTADLFREENIKLLLGVAASKNNGASDRVGEGHGNFLFYDENTKVSLPNYNKTHFDALLKYQGFSFLFEFTNSSASGIEKVFIDPNAITILSPTQISEFLVLGNSYVSQFVYVTKNMYSFDIRYEIAKPEFENIDSVLREYSNLTFGLSKYFNNNNLKLQTSYSITNFNNSNTINTAEILLQVSF
ncbi:MAG: hypothetical protein ACK4UK_01705 [Flavobacterium sp.]